MTPSDAFAQNYLLGHNDDYPSSAALRIALEREIRAEQYDRALPGMWSLHEPDTWLPRNPAIAGRLSRVLHTEARAAFFAARISDDEARDATKVARSLTFTRQKELLDLLTAGESR
jgi:hypothetical protein